MSLSEFDDALIAPEFDGGVSSKSSFGSWSPFIHSNFIVYFIEHILNLNF